MQYWQSIFIGVLAVLVSTAASLYAPWAMQKLTELITSQDPDLAAKSLHMGLILLATYILRGVCSFIKGYFTHLGAYCYVADLRLALYDKLQNLSLRYFADKQSGQIVSRIARDTVSAERLIAHVLPDLIVNALTLLAVGIMLFTINVKLAVISLLTIPFIIFANVLYSKAALPRWRKNSEIMGIMNGALQDNVSGMKEIQVFNQHDYEKTRMSNIIQKEAKTILAAVKTDEFVIPLIGFFSSLGMVGVMVYGGYLTSIGEMTVAEIVGFTLYLGLFYVPINNLSGINENLNNALAGCERVFEVLDEVSEVQEAPHAKVLQDVKGAVKFDNLTFHYTPGIPVLHNITLTIEPGQTVALVGTTGVGKTTISSLLNRFYDPVAGSILIDGVDIREVTLRSLRDSISMVLQDTFLFNGTVYENIVYGCKEATHEQVLAAAKAANAHAFIMDLENGYDTRIGERGTRLSGGQKQRISIARAVLRNTPILLLDEATSSLDMQTEKEIQTALDEISKQRTTLIIAHRLSTIRHADVIVVLDNNGIAEQGTHDDLLHLGGIYAKLHASQAS
ncbi:ABC transporter ATP-binding protein [Anaerosinus massiliensis]|uniref:ABC transporter ATP-binding protein n=1 Tax=Massilibacillus massiliensis TaxID=1806837 RepID=UPI0018FE879B|nr:ABC transporter ATP-binding protein [Massilibacillus massiliensis]